MGARKRVRRKKSQQFLDTAEPRRISVLQVQHALTFCNIHRVTLFCYGTQAPPTHFPIDRLLTFDNPTPQRISEFVLGRKTTCQLS